MLQNTSQNTLQNTTHVLIAEDNSGDVRLIRLALAEAGDWPVTFSLASDGEQAISFFDRTESDAAAAPDLVILDYNLPRRSGTDVLKKIRRSARFHDLPVVILSSSPEEFLREKLQDAQLEVNCCFTKPPDFDEFVELGKHIRRCYEAQRRPVG